MPPVVGPPKIPATAPASGRVLTRSALADLRAAQGVASDPIGVATGKTTLDAGSVELPPSTGAKQPLSSSAGQASAFDVRLGASSIKRVWTKLQGLLGVGDAGALQRAHDVVTAARAQGKALDPQAFAQTAARQLGAIRSAVADETAGLRKELAAQQARLNALDATGGAGDERAAPLRREVRTLEAKLRRAELDVLDRHVPVAFSLAAEASARALGLRPHDEQLQAGALLVRGKVVEQYTGEGKTLSALAPAVLSALAGRGVHIATSSEYLARRDAELMAPAYNALGLTVSALLADGTAIQIKDGKVEQVDRATAYRADVTYATAAQFGFDFLRDNLCKSEDERVQRGHPTLIMDEVDSLLIDDARTPLVIAGKGGDPQADVRVGIAAAVEELKLGDHIELDRSQHTASLTDEGFSALAARLGLRDDEMAMQQEPIASMVHAAVRARVLFTNGIDYIVKDGKVELIGKNGEMLPGRRLSAGLHQAIEAREGVDVQPENRTIGSITLRDYLGLYDRVGGMTGTAEVSERIFEDVYHLDVVRVPTHKPLLRKDEPPLLFRTIEEKALAIFDDAVAEASKGRPVLIGCPDERTVEALSLLFAERGVPHQCLTAANDVEEAKVIADAGRAGKITLSTPKGGRGVDFKLGGAGAGEREKQAVVHAGGLYVIGFAHNESARIDNQLRGRAGRQGEPGSTRFYASLEDRFFQNRALPKWVTERPPGPQGLSSKQVTALIEEHSALGESLMQAQLKDSLPYDAVVGEHRRRFLEQREAVLRGDMTEGVHGIVEASVVQLIERTLDEQGAQGGTQAGLFELYKALAAVVPLPQRSDAPPSWRGKDAAALAAHIVPQLHDALAAFVDKLGPTGGASLRRVLLTALDDGFAEHLDHLDDIRAGIGWQQLAQKDPKVVFHQFAAEAWREYIDGAQSVVTRAVMGSMPPVDLT